MQRKVERQRRLSFSRHLHVEPLECRRLLAGGPVVDLNGGQGGTGFTSTWSNTGAVRIEDSVVAIVSDGQSPNLASLTASISNFTAGDVLAVTSATTGIVASYDAGSGVLTLMGNTSVANYQTALRKITYNNTSGGQNVASRTINFVGSDGISDSATAVATVTIQPLLLDLNGTATFGTGYTSFWNNAGAVAIEAPTAAQVLDGKATNLTQLTAAITTGGNPNNVLAADTTGTPITAGYDSATGVLTLSGAATAAQYQQVLRTITYNKTAPSDITTYKSLPLPVPDTRANDLPAAVSAENAFLAALSSHGLENFDTYPDAAYGSTATQSLNFVGTSITGTAAFSGMFKLPPIPSPVSTPAVLVAQPPPQNSPPNANDILLSAPVTAFGAYFIQAGDSTADTLTLRLENTVANTSTDVVIGTVGPGANFNNVFYFGVTDTNPFDKITLLQSDASDGVLLDNVTVGDVSSLVPNVTINMTATDANGATSAASSLIKVVTAAPQIVTRNLFYNQSGTSSPVRYDGNNSAINSLDDNAIALDKTAYIPGSGAATFANVSSYTKGINGIMIDIAGTHGTITSNDFTFRMGNNNSPTTWAAAPNPSGFSVRAGAGVGGSDRIEITWNNNDIYQKWLEVIVKVNANTGLAQLSGAATGIGDVFMFGNAAGDAGPTVPGNDDTATNATVGPADELEVRNHYATAITNVPITSIRDMNRDAIIDGNDELFVRNHNTTVTTVTKYLNVLLANAAPDGAGDTGPVASALNSGIAATFFQRLAGQNTPATRKLLVKVDEIADGLGLDDTLLDNLLAELGLE
jgi:hypothetical protein